MCACNKTEDPKPTPSTTPVVQPRSYLAGCLETWSHVGFGLMLASVVFSVLFLAYDYGRSNGEINGYSKGKSLGYECGYKDGFNDRSLGREKKFH